MLAVSICSGWLQGRLGEKKRLRKTLARELGYILEEGDPVHRPRKLGLIRDLANLGGLPRKLEHLFLPGADLSGLSLKARGLRAAVLPGATLQGCDLRGADLWGADLSGVILDDADLTGADLRGANLEGASLVKANLNGANFKRARLIDANLSQANLRDALFDKAFFASERQGGLPHILHPSLEDSIRARVDQKGIYRARPADPA